jgi:CTP:molybdopterin cytidylyltransferase MocA
MIVGVLLAAGESKRMGSPKALVRTRGQSFLVRGVRALWTVCDKVVVVLGAHGDRVHEQVATEFETLLTRGLLAPELMTGRGRDPDELEVRFAFNKRWQEGMFSSARAGIATALRLRPKGLMLHPVDHPHVLPTTVAALGMMLEDALASSGGRRSASFGYAVVPRHRGLRGHPIALSAALGAAVSRDRTARDLADAIRRHAQLVGYLDVSDRGIVMNRNTPGRGTK